MANKLTDLINSYKILGLYGDEEIDRSLILISSLVELNFIKNDYNLIYITNEEKVQYNKKLLSISNKADLDRFDNLKNSSNIINDLKSNYLNKIRHELFMKNGSLNEQKLYQLMDKDDRNIVIIQNMDKLIDDFSNNGHSFIKYFKNKYKNSHLFYSFSFAVLSEYAKETDKVICIRSNYPHFEIEDLGNRNYFKIDKEPDPIFSIKSVTKIELENINRCTCGAIKTYGNIAKKSYLYHSDSCDLII